MVCSSCGHLVETGTNFCSVCGQPRTPEDSSSHPEDLQGGFSEGPLKPPVPNPPASSLTMLGILAVLGAPLVWILLDPLLFRLTPHSGPMVAMFNHALAAAAAGCLMGWLLHRWAPWPWPALLPTLLAAGLVFTLEWVRLFLRPIELARLAPPPLLSLPVLAILLFLFCRNRAKGLQTGAQHSTFSPPEREGSSAPGGGQRRFPVLGIVSDLQQRSESLPMMGRSITVMTFRVNVHDSEGNVVQRVPVEMRASHISGLLLGGDEVGIAAQWSPGKTLTPRKVFNLRTNSWIEGSYKDLL
jgi:hypothetical protein